MTADAVAVTGLGVITPAGGDAHSTWNRLCTGASTARYVPELAGLPVTFACPVTGVDLDAELRGRTLWRMSRFVKLAVLAARQAVADAGLASETWDADRVAVVLGTGIGGVCVTAEQTATYHREGWQAMSPAGIPMTIPNMAAGEVAIHLGARGPSLAPCTACASGASALALARDLLLAGRCDIALAGGTEAAIHPVVVAGFHRIGAMSTRSGDPEGASRPFASDRDGFVMGEASAVLVLEREPDARARRTRIRSLLSGSGSTTDAHHPAAPHPQGRGARAAVLAALADAGWPPHDVDHVNAHGTSTPANDAMEAALIGSLFPHFPSVTATKGVLGHTLGAAGAVEAAVTVLSIEHGTAPPIANLDGPPAGFGIDCVTKKPRQQNIRRAVSHSFGFGGHNVVLAFEQA